MLEDEDDFYENRYLQDVIKPDLEIRNIKDQVIKRQKIIEEERERVSLLKTKREIELQRKELAD